MATGNGTDTPGVNQLLLPLLQAQKGKRVGIVCAYMHSVHFQQDLTILGFLVLDFYGSTPGLLEAVIGI